MYGETPSFTTIDGLWSYSSTSTS